MNADKELSKVWRQLAINLEAEWRFRNGWVGDRRPEAIAHYVDREFVRLLNKQREGETEDEAND
jgi:hypothetical protein